MAAPLGNAGNAGNTGNINVDQTQVETPAGTMNLSQVTTTEPDQNVVIPEGEDNTPSKLILARNCVAGIGVLILKLALAAVATAVLALVYTIGGVVTGFLEGEGNVFTDLKNKWGKKAAIAGIPTAGLVVGFFVGAGRGIAGFFAAIYDANSFVFKLGIEEDPIAPIRTRFNDAIQRTRQSLNLTAASASEAQVEEVPPAADDTVPPAADDTVPPAADDTVPPAADDTVPPAADDTVPPAADDTVPPAADDTVPPAADDTVPPAADDTVPPAADDTVPPAADNTVPPAADDTVPPAADDGASTS